MAQLTESIIPDKLAAHDLAIIGDCTITDNRFMDGDLYCWYGVVKQSTGDEKGCITAKTCSPVSFTDARDRFCLTFGCKPGEYVANFDQSPVPNRRGGTAMDTVPAYCHGAQGYIRCLGLGFKRSTATALAPQNRSKTMLSMGLFLGFGLFAALAIRKYRPQIKSLKKNFG